MPELKHSLERLRDDLAPPSRGDAFESLATYRKRRRRRQRQRSLAVAIVASVAATVFVVRAFSPSSAPRETLGAADTNLVPRLAGTFDIGSGLEATAMLTADGDLWVAAHQPGPNGPRDPSLVRIEPGLEPAISMIPIDVVPTSGPESGSRGLAFGAGSIWVVGLGTPDSNWQMLVQRIDPSTNEVVATIPLPGRGGADVAASESGVWVSMTEGDHARLVRIDPTSNEITGDATLESTYVQRIVAVGGAVLALEVVWPEEFPDEPGPCGVLTSIDTETLEVIARSPVDGCEVAALAGWRDGAWVATSEGFWRVDPATSEESGTRFAFEPDHFPRSFLVADETGVWYAAYPGGDGVTPDRLTRIDPETGEVAGFMELADGGGFVAAVADGALWVLDQEGVLTRYDLVASAPSQ